ncbi:MAG: flagellar hook-length control protein FliK [Alphaproteobacteria bacterium]|nr:flagellar hook-length control protein FliK [Alphaproteobacteria bacterium]
MTRTSSLSETLKNTLTLGSLLSQASGASSGSLLEGLFSSLVSETNTLQDALSSSPQAQTQTRVSSSFSSDASAQDTPEQNQLFQSVRDLSDTLHRVLTTLRRNEQTQNRAGTDKTETAETKTETAETQSLVIQASSESTDETEETTSGEETAQTAETQEQDDTEDEISDTALQLLALLQFVVRVARQERTGGQEIGPVRESEPGKGLPAIQAADPLMALQDIASADGETVAEITETGEENGRAFEGLTALLQNATDVAGDILDNLRNEAAALSETKTGNDGTEELAGLIDQLKAACEDIRETLGEIDRKPPAWAEKLSGPDEETAGREGETADIAETLSAGAVISETSDDEAAALLLAPLSHKKAPRQERLADAPEASEAPATVAPAEDTTADVAAQTAAKTAASALAQTDGGIASRGRGEPAQAAAPVLPDTASATAAVATQGNAGLQAGTGGMSDNGSAFSFANGSSSFSMEAIAGAATKTQATGTYGFASTLSALRAAKGGTSGLPSVVDQVILQMNRNVKNGQSNMSLQLHPTDLGKITVKLEFGKDDKVQGTVVAENPKTLEMLQKDSRSLERALQDAGLRAEPGSLQFSLGEQHNGQNANNASGGEANRASSGTDSASDSGIDGTEIVAAAETYYITPTGVNIQV